MNDSRQTWRTLCTTLLLGLMCLLMSGSIILLSPLHSQAAPVAQANTGALTCQGNGTGRVSLSGSLVIVDLTAGAARIIGASDLQATGEGTRVDGHNWSLFAKWTGQITATDSNFKVRLSGANLSFTMAGNGTVLVHGQGNCIAQSGEIFDWVANAGPIVIAPVQ